MSPCKEPKALEETQSFMTWLMSPKDGLEQDVTVVAVVVESYLLRMLM